MDDHAIDKVCKDKSITKLSLLKVTIILKTKVILIKIICYSKNNCFYVKLRNKTIKNRDKT